MTDDYTSEYNKSGDLIYDLRQTRAEIISTALKNVFMFRTQKKYPEWFDALRDLKIVVNHQMKEDERKAYEEMYNQTIQILNKYSSAYNKTDTRKESVNAVNDALTKMEEWLWDVMEEHAIFGAKEEEQGLF